MSSTLSSSKPSTKRARVEIVTTVDPIIAERYQLITKIHANDRVILYTSWIYLKDIEYFENILNSPMKEASSRELKLNLSSSLCNSYIDIIRELNNEVITSIINLLKPSDILQVYEQLDFHRITDKLEICKGVINTLPYTIELYEWNVIHGVISLENMAKAVYQASYIHNGNFLITLNSDLLFPPSSEEELWKLIMKIASESTDFSTAIVWSLIGKMSRDYIEKYQLLFNPKNILLRDLSRFTSTFIDDDNVVIYINYIMKKLVEKNKYLGKPSLFKK